MKKSTWVVLATVFATLWILGAAVPAPVGAAEIVIGSLNDMTGATSDVGKDYAMGVAEAIAYVNDQGGINGKKIKLYQFDYGYRIPEALTKYNLFKKFGAKSVLGWGTGDTESLSPTITKDQIPYVSASYSAHLTDPKKTPYNLFFATDYSTNARAAITAWFDKRWPQHKDFGKRKPKFVCSYMFASPYCSAPIKAVKDQAELLGFEVGPDQDVSLLALDTKSQVLAMKQFAPDLVWHGNTCMSVAATLRDAFALGLGADHITNNWGFDENLPRLAGEAAEGVMGATVCAFFGENVPMMKNITEYAKKQNPGVAADKRLIRTVQGWGAVLLLAEALKRADKAGGDLSGPAILQKGFETLKDFDLGLGSAPVTFTAEDHRPAGKVPIYEYRGGKFTLVEQVDVKGRWPEKWNKDWLGW
jgi:branched-chain amino acid transport system substrate-binding protein